MTDIVSMPDQIRAIAEDFRRGRAMPLDAYSSMLLSDAATRMEALETRLAQLEQVAAAMATDAFKAGLEAYEAAAAKVAEEASDDEVLRELERQTGSDDLRIEYRNGAKWVVTPSCREAICFVGSPRWMDAKADATKRISQAAAQPTSVSS